MQYSIFSSNISEITESLTQTATKPESESPNTGPKHRDTIIVKNLKVSQYRVHTCVIVRISKFQGLTGNSFKVDVSKYRAHKGTFIQFQSLPVQSRVHKRRNSFKLKSPQYRIYTRDNSFKYGENVENSQSLNTEFSHNLRVLSSWKSFVKT